jgi:hypothetical protein
MDGQPSKTLMVMTKKMDDIKRNTKRKKVWDFGRNLEQFWLNEDGLIE